MSDGILENDTMFSVKKRPWHGLGTIVEEAPSIREAIQLANLDWSVSLRPLVTTDQTAIKIDSHKAVVRDDINQVLGVVGNSYTPLQNTEAFNWFEPFVENGLVKLETAGSLFNGKKIFILANTKMEDDVMQGDKVESFILLSNAHDGSGAVRVGFTPIRVVCSNTLSYATNSDVSQLIRVIHSKSVIANMEAVREMMDTLNNQFIATMEQYRALAHKDVNQADVHKYVKQVFSAQKLEDIVREYDNELQRKEEVENFRKRLIARVDEIFELEPVHNAWTMYNSVNYYLNHERVKDTEKRYASNWFGSNKRIDKKAFEIALNAY